MVGAWPLVGRSRELELFGDVLAAGERSALVLAGRAGVGKTRLAAECLGVAETRGFVTARVKGNEAARRLPFLALGPLLPPSAAPGLEPGDMLRRAIDAMAALGGGKPLVLLVDDAHLLDDASATVVHQLAATRAAFVVVTVRSREPAPDPIVALWKDDVAERVEVLPLEAASIEALLTSALGGPVSAATLRQLADRSAGNTMYLRELVLAGTASGGLTNEDGIWRLQGSVVMSSRLVELIEARIGAVPDPGRKVLEALAFGEPLGVGCLLTLADAAMLDALEQRGLIVSAYDGRRLEACLAHPLYGEVIRARIPVLRSQAVMHSLADRVQAAGARRRDDALRFATWRLETGGDMAPDLMTSAALTALNRWDLDLAARLTDAAVRAGAGFDAGVLQAEVALLQGRGEEAEEQLAVLLPLAGDDGQRARVIGVRVDNLVSSLGRIDDALRVIAEAEAVVTDPAACDQLRAKKAYAMHMGGRLHETLDVLQPLLERPNGPELAIACYTAGACLARAGRFAEAVAVTETIGERSTLQAGPSPSMRPSMQAIVRCSCLIGAGRLTEAADLASAVHEEGVAVGSMTVQAVFSLFLARAHLAMGDVAAAGRDARDAQNLFREKRWRTLARTALTYVAMSEALGGSAVEARAALAGIDGLGLPADDLNGIELRRARAWTEVAAGNLAAAHTHLREAAALARHRGDVVWESDVIHDLARLGWPDEAVARLHELEGAIEGDVTRIRAEHADALLADDPEALGRSSVAFEAMGAWLLAAEAAATAAVLLRRAGDPRRAAAAELRAAALARDCHGAITPALRAIETQAVLSAREIEVAALAAAGLANKAIATELTVSVRTVENHLQRVYEKLGVARRADLAQALASV